MIQQSVFKEERYENRFWILKPFWAADELVEKNQIVLDQIFEWLKNYNVKIEEGDILYKIEFENRDDATLFKLTWM